MTDENKLPVHGDHRNHGDDEAMTAETCDYCRRASVVADYPLFHAHCVGCGTRSLASSPIFHAAGVSGRLGDPYRKALGMLFGDDWAKGHEKVKAEAARIRAARGIL